MKNQWRMILALVLALIVIIFALLNTQDVAVNFIFGKFSLPLVLLLVISLLVGA
nr:lipopolysaccharide assembly protein LapA domain-containing protein [Liquorilactobacillus satsumensis]